MAEVASFGNIVNSLLALRQDYHEQLKAIPQYEAYLLVESSTEKAAGALHGSAGSPASIAAEVIDSLQFARSRFEQHLSSVAEYRTLLAIDRLIKEISLDLGVTKPTSETAAKLPEAAFETAAAPLSESPAPVAAEPEAEPAAHDVDAAASTPADAPLQPSRVMMHVDLDEAPPVDDDIVPVHAARRESSIEGGEDEDLLEIAYRDVTKAAADAGTPITAETNVDTWLKIDPELFHPRADFLHRVSGHSMREANILDGDIVGIHAQEDADNGQIVAAVMPHPRTGDDEITLKRYFRKGRKITLKPENSAPSYRPIEIDLAPLDDEGQEQTPFRIAGVYAGLIRLRG